VLSTLGLLCSAPLWPFIALAIKLEDGGPVFYGQERWGRAGGIIRLWKFRTMRVDANATLGSKPAQARDPRVTRVGGVLRKTGLDELPQLISIWRGEMSLVGPRALAVSESYQTADRRMIRYEEVPGFAERLQVRPGLTGLAAIYLAKDAQPEERFRLDIEYVGRQSFTLDLKLVALSVWISLRGRWEDRGGKL
jgi:lipopolysaccharide/colanic/teichoic acid biosynthesis glycosyltransferase